MNWSRRFKSFIVSIMILFMLLSVTIPTVLAEDTSVSSSSNDIIQIRKALITDYSVPNEAIGWDSQKRQPKVFEQVLDIEELHVENGISYATLDMLEEALLNVFDIARGQTNRVVEKQTLEQRIISLAPSHTEILYALGLGDYIVGWTQYEDYPIAVQQVKGWVPYEEYEFKSIEDELSKEKAVVGGFTSFDYDIIKELEPTLILAIDPIQKKIADELIEKGYNVLWSYPETIEDVYDMMIEIGIATNTEKTARQIVKEQKEEIEEIKAISEKLPKLNVYFEIGHEMWGYGPYALGAGSPMDQIMNIAGGKNIFNNVESLSFECDQSEVVMGNPDVIFTPLWPSAGREEVTTVLEISTRPGFEEINAVKNDRVYHYDSSMLKRPGPRQVTAIKKMAYLLHPYYFENPPNSVSPWELGKIDEFYSPLVPLK